MKRTLLLVLGLAGFGLTVQFGHAGDFDPIFGFYRPELFANFDSSDLVRSLPIREFLDGRLPGSTALGRMGTAPVANFPTALVNPEPRTKRTAVSGPVKDSKDGKDYSSAESMAAEKASLAWT